MPLPAKYHVLLEFDDGRPPTALTRMWGFIGIMTPSELAAHKYAGSIGVTPAAATTRWICTGAPAAMCG